MPQSPVLNLDLIAGFVDTNVCVTGGGATLGLENLCWVVFPRGHPEQGSARQRLRLLELYCCHRRTPPPPTPLTPQQGNHRPSEPGNSLLQSTPPRTPPASSAASLASTRMSTVYSLPLLNYTGTAKSSHITRIIFL